MLNCIEEFRIIFKEPEPVFYAGSEIFGHVLLKLSAPCTVRSIKLSLTGNGEVKPRPTENAEPPQNQEISYLSENWTIFDSGNAKKAKKPFPRGTTKFEFRRKLPPDLPTSFDSVYGSISYLLKASLTLPKNVAQKPKIVARKGLTVIRKLDLGKVAKKICCPFTREGVISTGKSLICCGNGQINFELKLPKLGYVPGENVPLSGVPVGSTFREPFWEKRLNLKKPNELYFCDDAQLEHVNKYPYWVGLANPTKFSRKLGSAIARQQTFNTYV